MYEGEAIAQLSPLPPWAQAPYEPFPIILNHLIYWLHKVVTKRSMQINAPFTLLKIHCLLAWLNTAATL